MNNYNGNSSRRNNNRQSNNYNKQNNNQNRVNSKGRQSPSSLQNSPKNENPQIDNLVNAASKTLSTSPDELKQAAQNGNLGKLLSQMPPAQAQRIQNILADENAAKKLLNSPQAQALLRSLSKNE